MFFNKSLIKCEKCVSCLMKHWKKYWKWPETYKLILHSCWTPQFQNFTIPPTWLSSHSITQKYCYPCIIFSLHNFKLLPICQLEFLGLATPLWLVFLLVFFLRFLRNCVSIIVNIVSNNTVLPCYLLWIFVSIRRLLQIIACIGVSTPPHLKNTTSSFAKSLLKSANYPSRSFLGNSHTPLQKINIYFFHAPLPTTLPPPNPKNFINLLMYLLMYFPCKNCNPLKKVTPFPLFSFSYCLSRNTIFINLLLLWWIMYFQQQKNFFFYLIVGWFWLCFFEYMCFLGCFFTILLSWNYFHE